MITLLTNEEKLAHPIRQLFLNFDDDRFCLNFDSLLSLGQHKLKDKKKRSNDEQSIQIAANKLWKTKYPKIWRCFFMIKNDGQKNKTITTKNGKEISIAAIRDKAMGLLSGVADCYLSIPNAHYHGMYIEFKTGTGKQSDNQKKFEGLASRLGYKYVILRSVTEFDVVLNDYMKSVDPCMLRIVAQYHEEIDRIDGINYSEL